ncbi:MAG: hypothetical protein DWG83_01700 [Chloroflexi bacterium]|nr:hypothetical protein [Chloroflexota bacterium]
MLREQVAAATREGLDSEAIADFLGSIDWTGLDDVSIDVRDALGRLEGWSTEFAEGDLTEREYLAHLRGLVATGTVTR